MSREGEVVILEPYFGTETKQALGFYLDKLVRARYSLVSQTLQCHNPALGTF
jgi:hypothetical protein